MAGKLTKSDKIELKGKKLKMAEMLANPEFVGTNRLSESAMILFING